MVTSPLLSINVRQFVLTVVPVPRSPRSLHCQYIYCDITRCRNSTVLIGQLRETQAALENCWSCLNPARQTSSLFTFTKPAGNSGTSANDQAQIGCCAISTFQIAESLGFQGESPAFTVPNSALGFLLTIGHVVRGEVRRSPPAFPSYLNSRSSGDHCRAPSWSPFTPSILANAHWL